jgi:hypothetical protein
MIEVNSNLNVLVRLLAAAILIHELLNICKWGTDYVTRCVAPVLGLKLTRLAHSVIHILLMMVAAWLWLTADARLLLPMLLLLSLAIASYSIRLSNHLLVSWFFGLILTIDFFRNGVITGNSGFGIRTIVVLTYAIAAFHKLNHDYSRPKTSCGVRLLHFYFDEGLTNSWTKKLVVAAIWGPVITEGAIPILLLSHQTRIVGILAAICLQALFGLARNAHFSVLMYAGLTCFLPPTNLSIAAMLLAFAVGASIAIRFSMWKAYPLQKLALVLHAVFGALTVYIFVSAISTAGISLNDTHRETLDWFVMSVVSVLFVLNGLSPYYSSKFEFSLAMFSNLRPDRRSHFIVKDLQSRESATEYVEIVGMHGMPKLTNFPRASFKYRLVRAFEPYEGRKYLKYYLVESLKNLRGELAADFYVQLADAKQHFRISSNTDLSALKHRKLCLMPAVLPSDPRSPYCN